MWSEDGQTEYEASNTKTSQSNTAQSENIFSYTRDAGPPAGKADLVSDYSLFRNNDNTCEILEFSQPSYQILVAPRKCPHLYLTPHHPIVW